MKIFELAETNAEALLILELSNPAPLQTLREANLSGASATAPRGRIKIFYLQVDGLTGSESFSAALEMPRAT